MKSFILLVTLICIGDMEGSVFTGDQESAIKEFVDGVLACRNIPGLTLSVIKGDEIWARGYGVADIETGRLVTNKTLFPIGSMGKAMTMTLLGYYLQKYSYDWQTKMVDLASVFKGDDLYEFPDDNTTQEVTVADLLAHATGLSGVTDYGFIAGYPEGTSREDLSKKIKYVPAKANLRETFIYNNLMYMVLGHVTERLGHDTWENLMTKKLLKPIGMRSSPILTESDRVLQDDAAKPYILRDGEMQPGTAGIYNITPLEPAGSIMSTGLDITKWMKFVFDNATTNDGKTYLDPEFFQQAFQEQNPFNVFYVAALSINTPTYPVDDITTGYGYAWFTSTYRGYRRVWHSGGLFSYVSYIWLYPDENIGLFASVNGPGLPSNSGTALRTLFWYLSDLLLGFEPWLNPETACSFPSPWTTVPDYQLPPHPIFTNDNLTAFVGNYTSDLLPKVNISLPEGSESTTLNFEMNRIKGTLFPTSNENVLNFEMADPWEYAIEREVTEDYTIRYPVEFTWSNETGENVVVGFNISFESTVIMPFKSGGQARAPFSFQFSCVVSLVLSCLLIV